MRSFLPLLFLIPALTVNAQQIQSWASDSSFQWPGIGKLTNLKAISASGRSALVLRTDGTVSSQGYDASTTASIAPLTSIAAVAAGLANGVFLKSDGTVQSVGDDSADAIPSQLNLSGVIAIASGTDLNLALLSNGTVKAWGLNVSGDAAVPSNLSHVVAIGASGYSSDAIKSDGTVVSWGETPAPPGASAVASVATNAFYTAVLGLDGTLSLSASNPAYPGPASSLSGVLAISAGLTNILALMNDGTTLYWNVGSSNWTSPGFSGITSIASTDESVFGLQSQGQIIQWGASVPNMALTGIKQLVSGSGHSIALTAQGTLHAWGDDSYGQIDIPTVLPSIKAVAAGSAHSLALGVNGILYAWGNSSAGQTTVPTGVQGRIQAVAAGDSHTVVLDFNGSVSAWGGNSAGQTTVPAAALQGVKAVAAGGSTTVALKDDGTLVAWGEIAAPPLNGALAKAIAVGDHHILVLLDNGTVLASGDNSYGQTSVPANLTGVVAIAAGEYQSLAQLDNGTVVAWGANQIGQTTVPSGLAGVIGIAAAAEYSSALYNSSNNPPNLAGQSVNILSDANQVPFTVQGGGACPVGSYTTPRAFTIWPTSGCTVTLPSQLPSTQQGARQTMSAWIDSVTARTIPGPTAPSRLIVSPGTYTASYKGWSYQLTTSASPAGAGVTQGDGWYSAGQSIYLNAQPSLGFVFDKWQNGSLQTLSTPTPNVTVSAPMSLVAHFLKTVTLTVEPVQAQTNSPLALEAIVGARGETFSSGTLTFTLNGTTIWNTQVTGTGIVTATTQTLILAPGTYTLAATLTPADSYYAPSTATSTVTIVSPIRQQ